MIVTALDTNVLVSLWDSDPAVSRSASIACEHFKHFGPITICGPVFSELLGLPGRSVSQMERLLNDMEILVDWNFDQMDWHTAGQAYQGYVIRCRAAGVGLPRRMLTDFLIGAHASVRGHSLLTLDQSNYRVAFPNLKIESY